MAPRILFPIALSLACTGTLSAQSPFTEIKRFDLTSTTHPSKKTEVVVGDFTGDVRNDMLLLDDGDIWIVYDPDSTETLVDIGRSATSIGLLPPLAAGDGAEIVAVTSGGIELLSDYDAGSFTGTARPSSLWSNATGVEVRDLDGDGDYDATGIASDGVSFVVARDLRDGSPSFFRFVPGGTVHDVAVGDWMSSAGLEILVLVSSATFDGVRIYDASGTVVDSVDLPSVDSGFLAAFQQDGYAYDRCAIVYRSGGPTYLKAADATVKGEEACLLGSVDTTGIDVGDVDSDGDDDVLIVGRSTQDAHLCKNASDGSPPDDGTVTFPFSEAVPIGIGPMSRDQCSVPGLGDFDDDGDLDLLFYAAATDELIYCSNTEVVDAAEKAGQLVALAEDTSGELYDGSVKMDHTVTPWQLQLDLQVDVPAGEDYVEVLVWIQEGETEVGDPNDGDAELDDDVLPDPAFQAIFPVASPGPTLLEMGLGDEVYVEENAYHIDLRTVELSGGTVVDAGPSSYFAFGLYSDVKDELEATYVNPPETTTPTVYQNDGTGYFQIYQSSDGRVLDPIVICIPDIPPVCLPPSPLEPIVQ